MQMTDSFARSTQRLLTRRQAVLLGAGTLGAAAIAGRATRPALGDDRSNREASQRADQAPARNVIFMVSDGMSIGVLSLVEPFARRVRGTAGRVTHWHNLLARRGAVHGMAGTASANSLVTDSAAAASAWGGGQRVDNGAINVRPDGSPQTPIAKLLRDSGRRVGLVTTTRVTHATPAGFATVQASRNDEADIAPQFLGVADVVLGGGRTFFDPLTRRDSLDLIGRYADAGYAFWDDRSQVLEGSRPDRVLGLFDDTHLPYTIDHRASAELRRRTPTLSELTRSALAILNPKDGGFFLMIEGGRIDHACHRTDAAGALWEQLAFDDAIGEVLDFTADRDDTLVIVTTDHGNANPGLNGMGDGYADSTPCFDRLVTFDASAERIIDAARTAGGSAQVWHDVVRTHSGASVDLSRQHAQALARTLAGEPTGELHAQHDSMLGILAQVLGQYTGLGWTGNSHTADLVPITAYGPGAQHFFGLHHNTDAFAAVIRAFGAECERLSECAAPDGVKVQRWG